MLFILTILFLPYIEKDSDAVRLVRELYEDANRQDFDVFDRVVTEQIE
jgi:hypothetical protein